METKLKVKVAQSYPILCDPMDYTVQGILQARYGGILELRRGIQDASCVGRGKSNLPFELRMKAVDCPRVTASCLCFIHLYLEIPSRGLTCP